VLGDMLELGDLAPDEHAGIGKSAAELGLDHLIAVGEHGPQMVSAAVAAGFPSKRAIAVADKTDAVALVTAGLRAGDVVLVKASRRLALDTVAADILTAVDLHRVEDPG
jgi:UDP-N-acetylmuramoyl-tripeptide--D-alanyl-D-alanine ligase